MAAVDVIQRLSQWKIEATDPKHPNYPHADLADAARQYEAITRLLTKLRTSTEAFGRDDVVELFGLLNSGRRMKNKVADNNPLPELRRYLLALLDGTESASTLIATANRAIRFAAGNMLGELYGWAHIDGAPLYNNCATAALAYLGHPFDPRNYDAFVAAHEEFKALYRQHVGHLRPELPLNLEIDKLYNVIDKVDLRRGPLGKPFDQMFASWDEAEWAFDLLADAAAQLELTGPEDTRATFNLRHWGEFDIVRLSYGIWQILGFVGSGGTLKEVSLALLDDLTVPEPARRDPFTAWQGQKPASVCTYRIDSVRPLPDALRDAFYQTLAHARQRFAGRGTSLHYGANKPALAAAVFDLGERGRLLRRGMELAPQRYWKVAPGENAWNWDACKEGGFITIGWEELGDVSEMSREEFDAALTEALAKYEGWTKDGADQVWTFAHIMQEGDRIVANRGTTEVLGIGTVAGPYYFVPDVRPGHRLPVHWDDTTLRPVSELGWRKTIIELRETKFRELMKTSEKLPPPPPEGKCPFSSTSFELLEGIHASPTKEYYQAHKEGFKAQVEEPFQRVFRQVAERLRPEIRAVMETRDQLFGRFMKNDWGKGGAWDFYWGAFYPKGGRRTEDAQLSMWMNFEVLEFGFYIGAYGSEQRQRFERNCRQHGAVLLSYLQDTLPQTLVRFGGHDNFTFTADGQISGKVEYSWEQFLQNPSAAGNDVSVLLPRQQLLATSEAALVEQMAETYAKLFPLVLLAIDDDPMPAIGRYQESAGFVEVEEPPQDAYDRQSFLASTYLTAEQADELWDLLHDRRQIMLYGPPGTGKSFVAQHLAKWVTGLAKPPAHRVEMIQFHPAYSYEDFIEGIRPESRSTGEDHFVVDYPARAGVFRRFCETAASDEAHPYVFIVDEINRGNIPRIFGELMLLLEYRDREVPLPYSGKRFRIPPNVYLIGTMNTADRSIALVDFALRRRFHFFHFGAEPDLLERWLADHSVSVPYLAKLYRRLSKEAIDDPDYAIGPSYFMVPGLTEPMLKRVWNRSIVPYLAEYLVEQRAKLDRWLWDSDFLKGIRAGT